MTIHESREFLLKAIGDGRLAAAYLFTGAGREERRDLAKFLAQAVFCAETAAGLPPCGRCSACRRVAEEKHPDLFLIRGEGVMGFLSIEQVRKLKSEIYLSPYEAGRRVYLLEVEAIREEAANAFLKTLEEPPETAVMVLLAQTEREFIPTILSRLARLRLPEPEPAVSDPRYLAEVADLSWRDPAAIFSVSKELAGLEEEELKLCLKEIITGLSLSLQLKEGIRKREDTPEAAVRVADRFRSAAALRTVVEKALSARQDILRGRATTRLVLDTLLVALSAAPEAAGKHSG